MEWYSASDEASRDRLENAWSDARKIDEELCEMLLEVARGDVLAYAPAETPAEQVTRLLTVLGYPAATISLVVAALGEVVPGTPARYVFAQLQQAKNLFNAGRIDRDQSGPDGYSFVPRPLTKEIQKAIRPQSGAARVF
ncbi:hypothetical protein QYR02_02465 [Microbacterium maritypicum]|uniref:hypothetical protein n=1 Tax=Microbacterium maritypicum TaxID=33918 RepID=UPI0026718408|nr:hypothetical protein [Microbacterium liquefaciens]WKT89797.1 hypothetical protein QYR02_02465 [Microbacterium liquefaciens]